MNLQVINTGNFKLDGGAMFGVVPKSMWSKVNPPDENNMCSWAMRCLLIEDDERVVLIDNGLGAKQSEKFFSFLYLFGDDNLNSSLNKAGYTENDITDMFLTHLHFDHCGGGVQSNSNGEPGLTFKNAQYWSNKAHWEWAINPNAREKASFLKENLLPMQEMGHLNFVEQDSPFNNVDILYLDGHTEKMMLPKIKYNEHTIIFVADLLPSIAHIQLPWIMSYDVRPLLTLQEKISFLNQVADNNYILFFEHDPVVECCTLKHTEKGVRVDQTFPLKDIL